MSEPDPTQAYLQAHCGTKAEAEAYAADIITSAAFEGERLPHVTVEQDRRGGWNVWYWE